MIKNKKIWIFLGIIIFVVIAILSILTFLKNDGMKQNKTSKVYYKSYVNNGWTTYSKDGLQTKDKNKEIKGFEFKLKSKFNGDIALMTYSDGKWSDNCLTKTKCVRDNGISAIKISLIGTVNKKNKIFYKVKNKDGWTDWYESGMIAGTKEKKYITSIKVKIIPREDNPSDYLKDYKLGDYKYF